MLEKLYQETPGFETYEALCKGFVLPQNLDFHFVYDVLDPWAQKAPQDIALIWVSPEGGASAFTAGDIAGHSLRLASTLAAQGVSAGSVVLVMMGNAPAFWPLMMALHRLCAVPVPVSMQASAEDTAYFLRISGADVVCAAGQAAQQKIDEAGFVGPRFAVQPAGENWKDLAAMGAEGSEDFQRPVSSAAHTPFVMYFTSGTGSLPKLVEHGASYPLAQSLCAAWLGVRPGGRHLTIADNGWSKASWGKLYAPWFARSAIVALAGERPPAGDILAALREHAVDSFSAPPSVYRALLSEDFSARDVPALRRATTFAEPMHREVWAMFRERTGLPVYSGFGQTENALLLLQYPGLPEESGSLGRPSPLFALDVVDADGGSCPAGVSGRLVVRLPQERSPGFFYGYHGGASVAESGLYDTGDIVWRDEWGTFYFVGRADDVIHSSGYRVSPYEVEEILSRHPGVREIAVYGVPDPLRHQVIKASVVLQEGYEAGEAMKRDLQRAVRGATAPYKCPRIVEFVENLPYSMGGKLRRAKLRGENKQ